MRYALLLLSLMGCHLQRTDPQYEYTVKCGGSTYKIIAGSYYYHSNYVGFYHTWGSDLMYSLPANCQVFQLSTTPVSIDTTRWQIP